MRSRRWGAGLLSVLVALGVAAAMPALAGATAFKEFSPPSAMGVTHDPLGITAAPDGNLWFTDGGTPKAIGRITTSGQIQEFTRGFTSLGNPSDITVGPDGNVWFAAVGNPPNAIGRVTPQGTIKEFPPPSGHAMMAPNTLTVGPDGNLWFLDGGTPKSIGKVTPSGTITEFPLPDLNANPNDLTVGPDGNLWFTDQGDTKAIGRITPAGNIMEFEGMGADMLDQLHSLPNELTVGSDGNIWFTDAGSPGGIGRVIPSTGALHEFRTGLGANSNPDPLTLGPDGNIWFIDQGTPKAIGQVKPDGTIKEFSQGLNSNMIDDITVGLDNNLWIEQGSNDPMKPGGVARITTGGVITEFDASNIGLDPGQGADGDALVMGPDGNLWFNDRGANAIGKISLQLPPKATTGAASAVTNTTATVAGAVNPMASPTTVIFQYGTTSALGKTASGGTVQASGDPSNVTANLTNLPPGTTIFYRVVANNGFGGAINGEIKSFKTTGHSVTPPSTQTTTAKIGNQQLSLTTPSLASCTSKSNMLSATLQASTSVGSHGAKLKFTGASFFVDKGARHTRKKTVHFKNGRIEKVTVAFFTANATVHHLPSTVRFRLSGLKSGTHTLKVVVSFHQTVIKRGHKRTVTVAKTLSARFRVC